MQRAYRFLAPLLALGMAMSVAPMATGCAGRATLYVEEPPPPPRREVIVSRPGYIWVQGHWRRDRDRWVWRDGFYERERPGQIYVRGRWERRGNRHVWVDGGWRARGRIVIDDRG